jgi:hypothetical protein
MVSSTELALYKFRQDLSLAASLSSTAYGTFEIDVGGGNLLLDDKRLGIYLTNQGKGNFAVVDISTF